MTASPIDTSVLPAWHVLLVAMPALLWLAAIAPSRSVAAAWRVARATAVLAVAAALASLVAVAAGSSGVGHGMRADAAGALVMLLVAFVGWMIVRYSQPYLAGEPRERSYLRWLAATLAAVAAVVAADHLLLLALAWTATSLSLHRLLNFFDTRPAAAIAAHKKFLVARVADLCMLAAVALLGSVYSTLGIAELLARAAAAPDVPVAATAAIVLIAFAALLKCAQLPFHGWLIQVMEAPTPVSALLHAGIVNLGGFVLIRLAPLVAEVPAAQALLVVAGTFTAVVAALVMTTRISVKVALAWSTCAQMGFMLMQCGLGAWEMALLHLVAHSLYKAHAFLGSGGAVRQATLRAMAPAEPAPGAWALAAGVALGVVATALAALAWSPWLHVSPDLLVLAAIVALATVPLARPRPGAPAAAALAATAGGAFALAFVWFGLHSLLAGRIVPEAAATPAFPLWVVVAIGFGALFAIQCAVQAAPRGALAVRLYPWCYGGLFLDERFSRALFRLAPPPLPQGSTVPPASTLPPSSAPIPSAARPADAPIDPLASGAR
jgi:NAD(P)H-quinone oxidoreductase subunit 5